ncbi:MAG: hypothetical protein IIX95_02515 [Clostridiales bacterium]|nr:hypothetical protein [Clostridiales bacterium]
MIRLNRKKLITPVIAMAVLSGSLLCACTPAATETPSSDSSEVTSEITSSETTTETTAAPTTTTTVTAETSGETSGEDEWTEDTEETEETSDTEPLETSIVNNTDIGYGPYGFMIGDVRFHSQNDVSMLITPEDSTIYDYGARKVKCSWFDAYIYEWTFGMDAYDYSNRFLSFYNEDTSVTFSPYKEIGSWTTAKGSELELYLAEITIITDNLEIKILPHYLRPEEDFNVSVNGRGYYVSLEQLQMVDFILSSLDENPGTDPLEGVIVGSKNHTYYF